MLLKGFVQHKHLEKFEGFKTTNVRTIPNGISIPYTVKDSSIMHVFIHNDVDFKMIP